MQLQIPLRPTEFDRRTSPRPTVRGPVKPRAPRRSGIVLVFVLVILLIAGLSLVGFARKSLELARRAAEAQEDLQRRWGTRSCQRFGLANAEQILEGQPEGRTVAPWPLPAWLQTPLTLGGIEFELRVSDEEAKLNLNALALRTREPQSLLTEIVQQQATASGLVTRVRIPSLDPQGPPRALFQTWEQLFDLPLEREPALLAARLQAATTEITCWGSGQLNLRRAADPSVRRHCEGLVAEQVLAKVLAARRTHREPELESLLRELALKPSDVSLLTRLLTSQSRCHAIWITATTSRRQWTTLTLDRSGQGNPAAWESWTW